MFLHATRKDGNLRSFSSKRKQWINTATGACSLFATFLMWCLVAFQHYFQGQYLPQVKKKLPLKDILSIKRKKLFMSLSTRGMTSSKYYGVITKRMNFDCHVGEISGILSHVTTTWSYMRLLSTF